MTIGLIVVLIIVLIMYKPYIGLWICLAGGLYYTTTSYIGGRYDCDRSRPIDSRCFYMENGEFKELKDCKRECVRSFNFEDYKKRTGFIDPIKAYAEINEDEFREWVKDPVNINVIAGAINGLGMNHKLKGIFLNMLMPDVPYLGEILLDKDYVVTSDIVMLKRIDKNTRGYMDLSTPTHQCSIVIDNQNIYIIEPNMSKEILNKITEFIQLVFDDIMHGNAYTISTIRDDVYMEVKGLEKYKFFEQFKGKTIPGFQSLGGEGLCQTYSIYIAALKILNPSLDFKLIIKYVNQAEPQIQDLIMRFIFYIHKYIFPRIKRLLIKHNHYIKYGDYIKTDTYHMYKTFDFFDNSKFVKNALLISNITNLPDITKKKSIQKFKFISTLETFNYELTKLTNGSVRLSDIVALYKDYGFVPDNYEYRDTEYTLFVVDGIISTHKPDLNYQRLDDIYLKEREKLIGTARDISNDPLMDTNEKNAKIKPIHDNINNIKATSEILKEKHQESLRDVLYKY